MERITSAELLELSRTRREVVEASLTISAFNLTHFVNYDGITVWDEGIDGEEREVSYDEFIEEYPGAIWRVDD